MDKNMQQHQFKRIKLIDDNSNDYEEIEESVLEILNVSIRKIAENEMKMLKEMMKLSEELNESCSGDKELWIENSFVFNI